MLCIKLFVSWQAAVQEKDFQDSNSEESTDSHSYGISDLEPLSPMSEVRIVLLRGGRFKGSKKTSNLCKHCFCDFVFPYSEN